MHIKARKFGLFAWIFGLAAALVLAGCDGLLSAEAAAVTEAAESRSAVVLTVTADEGTSIILIGTREGASYRADVYVQGPLPGSMPEPSEAEIADAAALVPPSRL
jgi:hypothetical protein